MVIFLCLLKFFFCIFLGGEGGLFVDLFACIWVLFLGGGECVANGLKEGAFMRCRSGHWLRPLFRVEIWF